MTDSELHQMFRSRIQPYHGLGSAVEPHLFQLDGIKAVVFDVYGTLVSSGAGDISFVDESDRQEELDRLMRSNGKPWTVNTEYQEWHCEYLAAIQDSHQASKLLGVAFPEVDILNIWRALLYNWTEKGWIILDSGMDWDKWIPKIAVEFETTINPISSAPEAFNVLASLRKAGLKLGIVSNAQFYTPIMLEAISSMTMQELGFEKALSVWSFQEGQAKPEKGLYKKLKQQAGKAFQLEPSQILYIGNDVKKDYLPALSMGFKVALYAGDPVSLRHMNCLPDEVEGLQPLILTRWEQLRQVLKNLV